MSQSTPNPGLVVGLTGGIASGKSLAARYFADCGAAVIDTDAIAREVVAPGTAGLAQVREAFGTDVITDDGALDRGAMRHLIFRDPAARERLEAITHPLINEELRRRLAEVDSPYAIVVVPLLIERGWGQLTDRVAVVDCSESQQRQRLLERDDTSPKEAERILASQLARSERLAFADDILTNGATPKVLRDQVVSQDALYRQYAA